MNGKRSHSFRVFTNFLAFLILIVVAVLVLTEKFISPATNLSALFGEIAKYLSLLLVTISSGWYVCSKRSVVIKIIWFICVAGIIITIFI